MKSIYRNIFLASVIFLITAVSATAADGDLDTTFGTNGIVTTVMGVANDIIQDIIIQPDGKIVAVGSASGAGGGFAIARYNADGTLDTAFGTGGKLLLAPAASNNLANAVALQADGKIVVVGQGTNAGSSDFAVVRLNANGTLDTSFDGDGIALTPMSASGADIARAVEIQTDGKIVVAGSAVPTDLDFAVARYNTDGSLDTTFDTDGKVTTNAVPTQQDIAYALHIQSDGKIVAAGGSYLTILNDDFVTVRYNADGSLDTTFDTDGIVVSSVGGLDRINRVFVQPDGKILAGGHGSVNSTLNFVLLRYNADGSLDTTFDTDGIATLLIKASSAAYDIAVQPNGKIIAAGVSSTGTTASVNFALARFNTNGSLDTTFGTAGTVDTPVSATLSDQAFAMRLQQNGKITVAGEINATASNKDFAIARYKAFTPSDAFVDFDGDGKSDYGIIRRPGVIGAWTWWISTSSNGAISTFNFGESPRDITQPLDYDGDGKDDIAMWRNTPQTGQSSAYYIIQSSDNTLKIIAFGQPGDTPTTADYDGDGKADLSVWRANTAAQGAGQATWFYRGTLNNPAENITYVPWGIRYGGQADQVDEPYPGDFDGDGKADFRLQRRADISVVSSNTPAVFITLLSSNGGVTYDFFGLAADRIFPGDYDGDGKTDIAVARGFNISPGNTTWYIRYTSGIPDSSTVFGRGFNFAQGDYDGDGKTDIGYFIPGTNNDTTGFWWISSMNGATNFFRWGALGVGVGAQDLPIAGYNNR